MRLVLAVLATLFCATSAAAQPPAQLMFDQLQAAADKVAAPLFQERSVGAPDGPKVLLMVGNLESALDNPYWRPGAMIVPTNTALDLSAAFPVTQSLFVQRVRKDKTVWGRLSQAVSQRKAAAPPGQVVLALGSQSFTTRLRAKGAKNTGAFPNVACFLATDHPQGGSIRDRDFFYQRKIGAAVKGCLDAIAEQGETSVVLPLVGSASFATADTTLAPNEGALLYCRLVNSVSGIMQGVAAHTAKPTPIRTIGVVIWPKDVAKMRSAGVYGLFRKNLPPAISQGLDGKDLSAAQAAMPDCQEIFGG